MAELEFRPQLTFSLWSFHCPAKEVQKRGAWFTHNRVTRHWCTNLKTALLVYSIHINSPGSRIFLAIMAKLAIHCFSVGTKAEEAKLHILGEYFTEATENSGNFSQHHAWSSWVGGWGLPPAVRGADKSPLFGFIVPPSRVLLDHCPYYLLLCNKTTQNLYPPFCYHFVTCTNSVSQDLGQSTEGTASFHDGWGLSWTCTKANDHSNGWRMESSGSFFTHSSCTWAGVSVWISLFFVVSGLHHVVAALQLRIVRLLINSGWGLQELDLQQTRQEPRDRPGISVQKSHGITSPYSICGSSCKLISWKEEWWRICSHVSKL